MGRFLVLSLLIVFFLFGCGSNSGGEQPVKEPLMLQLVNKARAQERMCGDKPEDFRPAVGPLTWNELLVESSRNHAIDMIERDFFAHEDPDGGTPADRVLAVGYQYRVVGENIAAGYTSAESVMEGWLNSPGHCKNIMYEGFKELGHARVQNHWVQNFGTHQ